MCRGCGTGDVPSTAERRRSSHRASTPGVGGGAARNTNSEVLSLSTEGHAYSRTYVCLSVGLSVGLSVCLSVGLSVCLSVGLSVSLSPPSSLRLPSVFPPQAHPRGRCRMGPVARSAESNDAHKINSIRSPCEEYEVVESCRSSIRSESRPAVRVRCSRRKTSPRHHSRNEVLPRARSPFVRGIVALYRHGGSMLEFASCGGGVGLTDGGFTRLDAHLGRTSSHSPTRGRSLDSTLQTSCTGPRTSMPRWSLCLRRRRTVWTCP